jgi:hypothetical protein
VPEEDAALYHVLLRTFLSPPRSWDQACKASDQGPACAMHAESTAENIAPRDNSCPSFPATPQISEALRSKAPCHLPLLLPSCQPRHRAPLAPISSSASLPQNTEPCSNPESQVMLNQATVHSVSAGYTQDMHMARKRSVLLAGRKDDAPYAILKNAGYLRGVLRYSCSYKCLWTFHACLCISFPPAPMVATGRAKSKVSG